MASSAARKHPLSSDRVIWLAIGAALATAAVFVAAVVTKTSYLPSANIYRAIGAVDLFTFIFTVAVNVKVSRARVSCPLWAYAPLAVAVSFSAIMLAPRPALQSLPSRVYLISGFAFAVAVVAALLWLAFIALQKINAPNGAVWVDLSVGIVVVTLVWASRTNDFNRVLDASIAVGVLLGVALDSIFDPRLRTESN